MCGQGRMARGGRREGGWSHGVQERENLSGRRGGGFFAVSPQLLIVYISLYMDAGALAQPLPESRSARGQAHGEIVMSGLGRLRPGRGTCSQATSARTPHHHQHHTTRLSFPMESHPPSPQAHLFRRLYAAALAAAPSLRRVGASPPRGTPSHRPPRLTPPRPPPLLHIRRPGPGTRAGRHAAAGGAPVAQLQTQRTGRRPPHPPQSRRPAALSAALQASRPPCRPLGRSLLCR